MRLRTGFFVLFGLVAVSVLMLWLVAIPPTPTAVVQVAPPPEAPPPAPAPEAAPPPAAPEEPALPQLPEVKVAERPIHQVPEDNSPPASSAHPLDLRNSQPAGQSDEVRLGAHPLAPPPAPRQFSGAATATGAVELKVDTTMVALFGIKPPGDHDRCGADTGSDCAAAARNALAERIGTAGTVSCRIPNPRPGTVAYAICLDPNGVDLSGFLIAQGLALADTGQSYDYVGAESIARNLKHGLWKFR